MSYTLKYMSLTVLDRLFQLTELISQILGLLFMGSTRLAYALLLLDVVTSLTWSIVFVFFRLFFSLKKYGGMQESTVAGAWREAIWLAHFNWLPPSIQVETGVHSPLFALPPLLQKLAPLAWRLSGGPALHESLRLAPGFLRNLGGLLKSELAERGRSSG